MVQNEAYAGRTIYRRCAQQPVGAARHRARRDGVDRSRARDPGHHPEGAVRQGPGEIRRPEPACAVATVRRVPLAGPAALPPLRCGDGRPNADGGPVPLLPLSPRVGRPEGRPLPFATRPEVRARRRGSVCADRGAVRSIADSRGGPGRDGLGSRRGAACASRRTDRGHRRTPAEAAPPLHERNAARRDAGGGRARARGPTGSA